MSELIGGGFVLLMFGLAAAAAAVGAALGAPLWSQIAMFVVYSLTLLALLRPALLGRLHAAPTLATGFQNLLGKDALVLEPVGPRDGRVRIGADEWSARTNGTETIEAGTEVRVITIDGATAVVSPKEN